MKNLIGVLITFSILATLVVLTTVSTNAEPIAIKSVNYTVITNPTPQATKPLQLAQGAIRECPVDRNGKPYCGNNCPLCK
jgi:hypothetical protein